jgi:allantoinase
MATPAPGANDDQPHWMTTEPPLVSIPYQAEWDDVQLLWCRRVLTQRYPDLVEEAFARLHEEGATSGRSFGLGLHPWLFGMPHRIRYLDAALARLTIYEGVGQATLGEIAAHVRAETARGS